MISPPFSNITTGEKMHLAMRGHNSPIIVMENYSKKEGREGKRFERGGPGGEMVDNTERRVRDGRWEAAGRVASHDQAITLSILKASDFWTKSLAV